jgi:hypothetical protein
MGEEMEMGWRVEQPVGEEAKSKLPRGLSQRREERGLEKSEKGRERRSVEKEGEKKE